MPGDPSGAQDDAGGHDELPPAPHAPAGIRYRPVASLARDRVVGLVADWDAGGSSSEPPDLLGRTVETIARAGGHIARWRCIQPGLTVHVRVPSRLFEDPGAGLVVAGLLGGRSGTRSGVVLQLPELSGTIVEELRVVATLGGSIAVGPFDASRSCPVAPIDLDLHSVVFDGTACRQTTERYGCEALVVGIGSMADLRRARSSGADLVAGPIIGTAEAPPMIELLLRRAARADPTGVPERDGRRAGAAGELP